MLKSDKNPLTSVGLILALVLLLVICYISYQSTVSVAASSRWVSHTYTVINQLNGVLSQLKDAETAQRGYLLTGDANHLDTYKRAITQLPQQILSLQTLTKDNPEQQQEILRLQDIARQKLQLLQSGIESIDKSHDVAPPETRALISQGKLSMDNFRAKVQHMTDIENQLLMRRAEEEQENSHLTKLWILLGNAAAISLLLFTFWLIKREIKHRKQAQAELEKTSEEIEDLYNNSPCAYLSVDENGLVVKINATALEWLGYSREEVINKKLHPDLMTPESAQYFYEKGFPFFKKQGWVKDVEYNYLRKDGSVLNASLNATVVYDDQGNYSYSRSSLYDITERKQGELKIRNLNHQLAQKATELETTNNELESFSYSVSHDLRSPLRAIDGYAHIFEEDYAGSLDAEGIRLLGVIRANSKRMGRLIDDLLAFSRLGRKPVDASEVDMDALVNNVWHELQSSKERSSAELKKPKLPPAWGDAALLKQVMINLLANAAKYSSKKELPEIEMTVKVEPSETIYSVRDNGVGFDMKYYNKLFGVFQRLHREEEFTGTGVGLAIVERVVGRHGGRVWAKSEINEGSIFSFSLPRRDVV